MDQIYVGLENEFNLMIKGSYKSMHRYWSSCEDKYDKPRFNISSHAIRTIMGNGIYVDGDDPEICTSPIRIEPGFASRFADSVYVARKELADFVRPNSYELVGFSSHWNISRSVAREVEDNVMGSFAIPYSLFTLTPLSCGTNLRRKDNRLELLGDYIDSEEQVRAFILFFAATMISIGANYTKLPFFCPNTDCETDVRIDNLVKDGRDAMVAVKTTPSGSLRVITAQTYLETYYEFFLPALKKLGTEEDLRILDDFVRGKKELEIDKMQKYAVVSFLQKPDDLCLEYHPFICIDLDKYKEERNPPECLAKFLGRLVSDPQIEVESMEWHEIVFKRKDNNYEYTLSNLDRIYVVSRVLEQVSPQNWYTALDQLISTRTRTSNRLHKKKVSTISRLENTLPRPVECAPLEDLEHLLVQKEWVHKIYSPGEDHSGPTSLEGFFKSISSYKFSWENVWDNTKKFKGFFLLGTLLGCSYFLYPLFKYDLVDVHKIPAESHLEAYAVPSKEAKEEQSVPFFVPEELPVCEEGK